MTHDFTHIERRDAWRKRSSFPHFKSALWNAYRKNENEDKIIQTQHKITKIAFDFTEQK